MVARQWSNKSYDREQGLGGGRAQDPIYADNVEWGDASHSKVLGLGKVVISHDLTIEKVMLVESLAFNLLSVRQIALMGFATFFDIDTVVLLWSKTLKVAFVGHVENDLYVINFSE